MGSFKVYVSMFVLIAMLNSSSSYEMASRNNFEPSLRDCLSDDIVPTLQGSFCPKANPCKNGGKEQPDGTCVCTDEYTGTTCEEKVNPCKNGGIDLPSVGCVCTFDFTGSTCEVSTDDNIEYLAFGEKPAHVDNKFNTHMRNFFLYYSLQIENFESKPYLATTEIVRTCSAYQTF
ncbi:hypothetical protein LOTGIDRAFT_160117 [Lottia gigantea]|uniref:EGF-like domain-containing protein n=1 Tax=Lottia gigantea TaxID=225164 RepID=V4AMX6_LOTGI|nr:hypothetical protein LOTGIDRAFT_160117 [Lottia gigantea]ESO96130.1 hypothetical protein LOTGIDRAFT_160117 [Lottia gigantea]